MSAISGGFNGSTQHIADNVRQTKWLEAALSLVRDRGLNVPGSVAAKLKKTCPQCDKPRCKLSSKHGSFWGCTGQPDCTAAVQIGGKRKARSA